MKIKFLYTLWVLLAVMVSQLIGCAPKPEETATVQTPSAAENASAQVSGKKTLDLTQAGTIQGKIAFDGEVPAAQPISVRGNPECAAMHAGGSVPSEELLIQDEGIQNAFVYIKEGLQGYQFETPKSPATVNNIKCLYVPHVLGVQTGQPVEFRNSDSTLHNVHAFPKINKGFNLGLPFANMKQTKTFSSQEIMVPLKCDVHPWMLGYVGVVDHPYFAVTDATGRFELKNVPAGEYLIEVWHEKLGVQSQTVKIEPQASQNVLFTFRN